MLTLLTATGARPEAWAICEKLMLRQTYTGPVHWVIVDDGEQAQPVTFSRPGWKLEVIRPTPFWKEGQNTQARNLRAGLEAIRKDALLVIIEDDDHYRADWLEVVASKFDRAELIGECQAKYYNVQTHQARELHNNGHASLCSTGMRGPAIERFRAICQSHKKFIDLELWRKHNSRHLFSGGRVVGIKGMRGRGGIGAGHRPTFSGDTDTSGEILRRWIGKDAEFYL